MLPAASVATPSGKLNSPPSEPLVPDAQFAATVHTSELPLLPLGFTPKPIARLKVPSAACAGPASPSTRHSAAAIVPIALIVFVTPTCASRSRVERDGVSSASTWRRVVRGIGNSFGQAAEQLS